MKFQVLAALIGYASAVQIVSNSHMEKMCEGYEDIELPVVGVEETDISLLQVSEEAQAVRDNVEDTSVYGKTMKQINAENQAILKTTKQCQDFVKSHPRHTEVCSTCSKLKTPKIRWRWDNTDQVWYRWYNNQWHYWGPSKKGFVKGGWSWSDGYWHHGGYVFKYNRGNKRWYRFQNKKWIKYGKKVPVKPDRPSSKKICRPFYRLQKAGFSTELGSKKVPRCQVGNQVYMWQDSNNCKFLGGKLTYQEHQVCKSGKSHTWKKVIKCVKGADDENRGFDYKTGKLSKSFYNFQQCSILKGKNSHAVYIYLYGKCHWIPNPKTYNNLYDSWNKIKIIPEASMKQCRKGRQIKNGASLMQGTAGQLYLNNWGIQYLDKGAFSKCKFDKKKLKKYTEEQVQSFKMGDIITT